MRPPRPPARRLPWALAGLLLLAVGALGGLVSVSEVQALATGGGAGAWILRFVALVVVPLSAAPWCAWRALGPR